MKAGLPVAVFAAAAALSCYAQSPVPTASPTAPLAAPGPGPNAPASAAGCCRIPAGTVVAVELSAPVSSTNHRTGDVFALRLAEPLIIDGAVVVPAGTPGGGEIIDVASAGLAGHSAKLVLAARYIDFAGARIPLHGFHVGGGGHDNTQVVMAADIAVGLVSLLIPGGNITYKAGTRANAHVTADVLLPSVGPPATTAVPAEVSAVPPTTASPSQTTTAPTKGSLP